MQFRALGARAASGGLAHLVLWPSEVEPIWHKRFYDFNVWSERKRIEKLRYMHRNPLKRGLVERPEQWKWSSFRAYCYGEAGAVRVNFQEWPLEIKRRRVHTVDRPSRWRC